ncbi:MAG: SDR family NAD(P)-dependent oxidoreductase [Gammaproteobacteria bacterium]|nr:SDR family NAD(P)-dependent oxidoreductase [Gammaproteobacteria bacterium]
MNLVDKYGPWALISGASSGLGEEFARQLAAQGLNLVLLARRTERLESLGKELKSQHGIDYRAVSADLADPDFLAPVADQTEDLEIGLLINNAGFTNSGNFLDNDLQSEIRLVDVNCRAAMILAHHYGQGMRQRKRGGMIFTASIAGFVGIPFWGNYSASKSFDLKLAEALGAELKPHGVDVLALCPGATRTEFATYDGLISQVMTMPAEPVVAGAIKRLGKRRTWVAGLINRINVFATRFLPRTWSSILFGVVVRDIVKH